MNSKDSPFSILEKLEKQICWKIGPSPSHLKWKLENALLRSESCKPSRYGGGIVGLGVKIHTKKWGNKKQTERDVYIYNYIYWWEKIYTSALFYSFSVHLHAKSYIASWICALSSPALLRGAFPLKSMFPSTTCTSLVPFLNRVLLIDK